ncbi:unknown [Mycoplasma sp. CAG:877]|nr:unknown [Mycoplasma sp. CAG:877]
MNNIYVCDFDEVEKLCKTIDSNINTLQNDLNTSKDNLLSTLSSNWNGSSFSTFADSVNEQHGKIDNNIKISRNVIDVVKDVSKKIQELEEDLTGYDM